MKYFLLILACLIAAPAAARDIEFSWIQNPEKELTGYEVYCNPVPASEIPAGESHEYWKPVSKGDIVAGDRINYSWVDFPEARQYCVCVAQGLYGTDKRHSDFSKEIEVPAYVPPIILPANPVAPTEFRFEILGTIKLTPVN